MTLKQNFIPWNISMRNGFSFHPLTASLYVNTVFGHEFWRSQPGRYPDGYYELLSTKFRLNIVVGQRITWQIPKDRRKRAQSISFFYEVSSCDLYIRSRFEDHNIPLKDIIGLSLGLMFQLL